MALVRAWHEIMEFCYPPACLRCKSPSHQQFCDECEAQLAALIDRPRCDKCARPVFQHSAPCPWCRGRGIYPFKQIAALGVFREPLRDLIHMMKYHRRWAIGEQLAARLARLRGAQSILSNADLLVPVPLWRWRQVHRGYNQADVIARQLAAQSGKKVLPIVARIRRTASQTQLNSRRGRVENVRDAFGLKSHHPISGRRIVLVDDVMTSAATLKEVGRVILQAQPLEISAITLAVADPRGRSFQAI